jgi:glycosyltransferase involved in cell wall biosynthesis
VNERLESAVNHCHAMGIRKALFIVPFPISFEDASALKAQKHFAGMILRNPDPKLTADSSYMWLGCYASDEMSWQLPGKRGKIVFVGPSIMLTPRMVRQLRQMRAWSVICEQAPGVYASIPLYRFRLWNIAENIIRHLSNAPKDGALHRVLHFAKRVPGAARLWHRFFKREDFSGPAANSHRVPRRSVSLNTDFFRGLLDTAAQEAVGRGYSPIPGRIILVNAGLAAGGAERQIANTLIGLKERGYEDILFLGEYLHRTAGLDFHLPLLLRAGIAAEPVTRNMGGATRPDWPASKELISLLCSLPGAMPEEILNLAEDFKQRRPELVHAWQDSTSIKAAIAGLIAGVPRIVLASRNLIPENFAYYQEYMRPAYQALMERVEIVFLNNSDAGAEDYSRWLDAPAGRFSVLRNGVELSSLAKPPENTVSTYRRSLGIPQTAPVVGSVFRFWSEKRPMLWLETAKVLAAKLPEAHFLVIGDGPMREEMESFIRKARLNARFHLPGSRCDVAMPLSAMSAFLLTSEFEGTPNVLLEAQWLGLPVVATDAGGTREAIHQGVTGWCCSEPDPEMMAMKLFELLTDPAAMERCHAAGPSFVAAHFGMDRMIDETLGLYFGRSDSAMPAAAMERAQQCPRT